MGNCLFGGLRDGRGGGAIKVITSTGAILEFHLPLTAGCIANEFPGHAIFPSHDLFWTPVSLHHRLRSGHSYYLLPLTAAYNPKLLITQGPSSSVTPSVKEGHIRSKSSPSSLPGLMPYRMSLDSNYHHQQQQGALKRSYTEAFSLTSSVSGRIPKSCGNGKVQSQEAGFWKVKLVISPDQLLQILSQETSTHDLVHNVSTVAKCGGSSYSTLTSNSCSAASSSDSSSDVGLPDDWIATAICTCTSRNASSKKDRHSLIEFPAAS